MNFGKSITGGFNTQPPEGGWLHQIPITKPLYCFNTQPPEGGWCTLGFQLSNTRSFNTQPPEGGW